MIEGKKYYNWSVFKPDETPLEAQKRYIKSLLSEENRVDLVFTIIGITCLFLFSLGIYYSSYQAMKYVLFYILIFIFPMIIFFPVSYLLRLLFNLKNDSLWIQLQREYFKIQYLFSSKKLNYKDIKSISIYPYEGSYSSSAYIHSKNLNSLSDNILSYSTWQELAKVKNIPLIINWDRNLDTDNSEYMVFMQNKDKDEQKIPFEKWQGYLKTNPNIEFTNQTTFENYKSSEIPEDEIIYYYEWKENKKIIAFVEYIVESGRIGIDIYKDKLHLVGEVKEFLEADLVE